MGNKCRQSNTIYKLKDESEVLKPDVYIEKGTERHTFPSAEANNAKAKAAEGAACESNDDCESAWCNMWAIPHVCGGDEMAALIVQ